MGLESLFGSGYDLFNSLDGLATFIISIQKAIEYVNDTFKIWKKYIDYIPSNLVHSIPFVIMIFDVGKLFTGFSYINEL